MKKKLIAATALTLCALFAGAGAAQATSEPETKPATATDNKPSTWGDNCVKVELGDGVKSYQVPVFSEVIVVKAGRENTIYRWHENPAVTAASGKDISHVIYCPHPDYY
jgi:invasion protein IalB